LEQGDLRGAEKKYRDALAIVPRHRAKGLAANPLTNWGLTAAAGKSDGAEELYMQALDMYREVKNRAVKQSCSQHGRGVARPREYLAWRNASMNGLGRCMQARR